MPMKIIELTTYLESLVPIAIQEDYDNSGLIIGDHEQEINGVLICLDVTEEVLVEAIRNNCNMVIAHHPLIFHGIKKLTGTDLVQRLTITAIKENIAVYAIHTNLDNALEGLNAFLCYKIGLRNCRILSPKKGLLNKLVTFCPEKFADQVRGALFEAGAGQIGNYDSCSYNLKGEGTFKALENANPFVGKLHDLHFENELRIEVIFPFYLEKKIVHSLKTAHPSEEVAYDIYPLKNDFHEVGAGIKGEFENEIGLIELFDKIKALTGLPVIRHTLVKIKKVKKIALCTGSGSFLIQEAINANVDVFLTSDLKYHDFFLPVNNMCLADIGHYESEQVVKEWIYSILIEKFSNFAIFISKINTNPVNYY